MLMLTRGTTLSLASMLFLLGCSSSRTTTPPLSKNAREAISVSAASSPRGLGSDTVVASSSAETPLSTKWHIVIVSRAAISIDAGPPIVRLPFAEARDGIYIAPLGEVLRAMDHGHELVFAFDPATPYQLVIQTLYTASVTEVTKFHLAVRRNGSPTEFVSRASPATGAGNAPSLGLVVLVSDEGASIRVRGGYIGANCALPRENASALMAKGVFDMGSLAACAGKLRARYPEAEDRVIIGAAPSLKWETLVRVADALRATGDGIPLFPSVEWAVVP
ncbi:hypothetical protein LZC95_31130 [Pendulispora brunnea]|uniref:Uncharacterized protein n=1 Tax=Pendulispora brunnea TaxID=2905690 RepID=A0ABZ2JWV1_9BACT